MSSRLGQARDKADDCCRWGGWILSSINAERTFPAPRPLWIITF
jgi:hypothetical protein